MKGAGVEALVCDGPDTGEFGSESDDDDESDDSEWMRVHLCMSIYTLT